MIFTSLCTDPPPPSPLPSVKIVEGAASPIFTEGRLGGGGGLYTGQICSTILEKKLHCDCQEKKYTYLARSSIHSPYFQQASRLFRFPSQGFISHPGQILPEERVFCWSVSVGYSCRKVFKTILLANNLPMYMYTYVAPPGGTP